MKEETLITTENIIKSASLIAGKPVISGKTLAVNNPYNGHLVGTVEMAGLNDTQAAIDIALKGGRVLTRYERYSVLDKTRTMLLERKEEFAQLITAEAGLCITEARYEIGRAHDVLLFASMECLKDDGQVFSCDISPNGKQRKIFTLREPLKLAVAITPFNHPLNQVAHKIAPALAAGTPVILKPSEKTPLTAIRLVELLYQAGLPTYMLSVLLGDTKDVAEALVQDPRVDLVSFTGSVAVGKKIAQTAGYKKVILELGGNDPLIVLEDANLDLAVTLAAEGSFRNSGQRCTAVKRILVQESIAKEFTKRFVEKAKEYTCGDPANPETKVGTVIDEQSALYLESVVDKAVARGARVLLGGKRTGALLQPTVIVDVPRDAQMIVQESFGPLAPILTFKDIDDAISLSNSTAFGLSSGVVTNNMEHAIRFVKELKVGTVNINEVPGYRIENSPFGGIKDSGLGIKEGVIEAIKCFTTVKTFSMPW
ncbi:aldehyde dehydrogenase (NAD+) [Mucilaginibacter lappiensis]|uniref:Aldehyde dehydrogenase (NAD+) n=1 Tax=Mucilaginibacter lappiensis TaxID=354630 RepID=A0ABR6PD36_9SPHI|nr:phosphonoacetaldehyde dehydrogenase [Mucilaginibacter lappiensis]MBB6107518.1 aldehyde dehydrogenase (NAD+) [Mucilaginibacter lappiensis]SIQ05836.1 aldehyde dehydrogenase (NAD+) [Mucilaginibacter lappiensis]